MAARKLYSGYTITHLREWARELKVAGYTRMTGEKLLTACDATNDLRLAERECVALGDGTTEGVHFAMTCGCVIVATTAPIAYQLPNSADRLFVHGRYVSLCDACCHGWTNNQQTLNYRNDAAERDGYRFFLWSLRRVVVDMFGARIAAGARVESYAGHSDGEHGTVEGFDANGWPIVEFDFRPGDAFECDPTHIALVTASDRMLLRKPAGA